MHHRRPMPKKPRLPQKTFVYQDKRKPRRNTAEMLENAKKSFQHTDAAIAIAKRTLEELRSLLGR